MQGRGESGLWELFLPGLRQGDLYKFEIRGRDGFLAVKADPYAFAAELRPQTASVVWDLSPLRMGGRGVDDGAPRGRLAATPREHLRSAPRLLARCRTTRRGHG